MNNAEKLIEAVLEALDSWSAIESLAKSMSGRLGKKWTRGSVSLARFIFPSQSAAAKFHDAMGPARAEYFFSEVVGRTSAGFEVEVEAG